MQLPHAATVVDVAFDDPNLIADAGLVPVLALAEQVGLPDLVDEHLVRLSGPHPAQTTEESLEGQGAGQRGRHGDQRGSR